MKAGDSISSILHSRSQSTTESNDQRQKIVTAQFSVMDKIFPLLNEMLKTGKVPAIIEHFLVIHIFFQIFAFSLWPAFTFLKLTDKVDDVIGLWIYRIAFLSEVSGKVSSLTVSLILFSILIFLFIFSFGIELFIFFKIRRFNKILLHVARTCFDVIPMLTLLPISSWCGIALKYAIKQKTTTYIVYTVISFIYLIIVLFAHHVQSYFSASLPYIPSSHITCWSGVYHFEFLAIPAFIMLISYIADFFPNYFMLLLMFVKIAYNIFMIYNIFFFPFSHIQMNDFFCALFMAVNVLDVIKMLDLFNFSIRFWILLVASISSFFVCLIISKLIFKWRIAKICRMLDFDILDTIEIDESDIGKHAIDLTGNNLVDEKLRHLYHGLGLDRSSVKCEMYFRIGLANRCNLFLNWSLIKYAAEYHKTPHMYTIITQFLSFYPCEARLLSSFFNQTCAMPLNFTERFLMFQINIIKQLRQSSASRDVAELLMQLKTKANTIIDDVRKFWITCPDEMNVFYDIQMRTKYVRELYSEAMEHYPNNVKICESYSSFLVEGAMDFKEGVKMRHRANLLEQGKNLVVDFSFRSLVRAYPEYLKKNVMNIKGQFIQKRSGNNDSGNSTSLSSSSNKNSNMSSGTIDGVLDPEIEEVVARNCFTYHRLRLEFQNCLENRKIKYDRHLHGAILWSLFCVVVLSVFFIAFYYDRYTERLQSIQRLINIGKTKYNLDGALLASLMKMLAGLGAINQSMIDQVNVRSGSPYEINVKDGDAEVARFTDYMTSNLSIYMNDLMGLAQDGRDISEIFTEFVETVVPIYQCNGISLMKHSYNETLKELFIRIAKYLRGLHTSTPDALANDDRACETIANVPNSNTYYRLLSFRILKFLKTLEVDDRSVNKMLMIIIPCLYAIITIPPLYLYLWLCLKELRSVHGLLVNLNQPTRETASKSLSKIDSEEITLKDTMKSKIMLTNSLYFFALLPVINALMFLIVPIVCINQNSIYNNYNYWAFYSSARSTDAMEAVIWSIFAVSIGKGFPEMAFNKSRYVEVANTALHALIDDNNNLLRGGDNNPSCIGFTDDIDTYNIRAYCVTDNFTSIDHKDYMCSSLDSVITSLFAYLNLVLQDPGNATLAKDTDMANAFHLTNTHIVERAWQSTIAINTLAKKEMSKFRRNMCLICVACIAVSIIITLGLYSAFGRIEIMYKGELQQLRRVAPLMLSQSQPMMNYITHKDDQKKVEDMAPTKSIVYLSKDSVIFLNKNLNIETINQATTDIFGYTPDQILGQPFNTILSEGANEEFYKNVEMMKTGQCALVYMHSFQGVTDDDQVLPVHVTLIGIPDTNSHLPKAFVTILRNESELIRQRQVAETAKAQSEKLLYQILPRDIVVRLNRGETDINFTVPSATIIFIDIVKFSNYAATLTPAEIMEHLSIIFAKFDFLVKKYPLITKIKLIGDVYMAAGGLFSPEENPQNHAIQIINFALEALMALEEANNQFNASLMVRIGVNTNGPLIAGVLGTDKPVFDIIGDPINVASRLQSTAVPGTIQISQETFDLISNMNYNVEKRGEIELKGKGKKTAYVVRPLAMSSFFSISQELDETQTPKQPQV